MGSSNSRYSSKEHIQYSKKTKKLTQKIKRNNMVRIKNTKMQCNSLRSVSPNEYLYEGQADPVPYSEPYQVNNIILHENKSQMNYSDQIFYSRNMNNEVPIANLIDIEPYSYNKPSLQLVKKYDDGQSTSLNCRNYPNVIKDIPRSNLDNNLFSNEKYRVQSNLSFEDFGNVQFKRPVVRSNSLNDYRRSQFLQYGIHQKRYHSVNDVDKTHHFGCYESRISLNHDKSELPLQDDHRPSSENGSYSKACHRGFKRHSWNNENLYGGSGYNPDKTVDISYAGPRVKRRSWDSLDSNHSSSGISNKDYEQANYQHSNDLTNDDVEDLDEYVDVLDILSFPDRWSSCSLEKTGFVEVPFESVEGRSIQTFFHRTNQTRDFQLIILGITRIENPFLHTMYLLKKEEIKSRNGHVDELFLFHGTKSENLEKICEENLDWRRFSNRHRFGQGVSFSPLATYSSHYCDSTEFKVMLLFKVLVSNVVIGSEDMVIPPNDDVTFDTSIKEDTSVVVKYSDNEFYPMYKIIFTKQKI